MSPIPNLVDNLVPNLLPTSLFNPISIDNNILWLDAADTNSINDMNGQVCQWDDKSGEINNATELTASMQPITNLNNLNGRNVINWDDTDDLLTIPAASSINNIFQGGGTFFTTLNTFSGGNKRIIEKDWIILFFSSMGGTTSLRFLPQYSLTNGDFRSSFDITFSTGTIIGITFDSLIPSNPPIFYINGAMFTAGTVTAPAGTVNDDSGCDMLLGNNPGNNRTFDGDMAENTFYDRILTAEEIDNLTQYFSTKWI